MKQNEQALIGKKFYCLTIEKFLPVTNPKNKLVWVNCDCGNSKKMNLYKITSGRNKSCGCMQGVKFSDSYLIRVQKFAYAILKAQAKDRDIELTLTFEDFIKISEQKCAYTGRLPHKDMAIQWRKKLADGKATRGLITEPAVQAVSWFANGIDRINSEEGYHMANSVACCSEANRAKSNLTTEEFRRLILDLHANLD